MRWHIVENKKKIATEDMEGHRDDVEMSGEATSYIVTYSVEKGVLRVGRRYIYPMVRIQPDVTQSSYQLEDDIPPIDFGVPEKFVRAEFDGVLSLYTKAGDLDIVHRFYPSVSLPADYETVEIENRGASPVRLNLCEYRRMEMRIACEGYVYAECTCGTPRKSVPAGGKTSITFVYSARFANGGIPREKAPLARRRERVRQLMEQCDLTTGDDVIDAMFAFAKLRVGESIFRTRKGRVHSPGGTNYYAAVWCNDQCEYSTPWFGFTNDPAEAEAADNAMCWYEPFMNDAYEPIPSSVISEGTDYWNGRRDRGDAEMYLYGNCRFFLERGELPDARHTKMLEWCAEYTLRQITADGVVFSDTDELEFRLSSGINLSTSSLAYGAFRVWAVLLERMGRSEEAGKFIAASERIAAGIEKYFGGEVAGYRTYHYHKGCDEIRAWNCLPIYMGIDNRADETLRSVSERLWCGGSCRSTENEEIMWDRSALYFIAALFRAGRTEEAYRKLHEFSETRLLGERTPYAVEAYPEFNMRHLSAESGLFCRIVTDGLLDIRFEKEGFRLFPHLPRATPRVTVERIRLGGGLKNIRIEGGKVSVTDCDV